MESEQSNPPRQAPQVYKTEAGQWRCVDCSMWGHRESYPAASCADMLEHLMKHQQLGEKLPEAEVNILLREFWEAYRGRYLTGA